LYELCDNGSSEVLVKAHLLKGLMKNNIARYFVSFIGFAAFLTFGECFLLFIKTSEEAKIKAIAILSRNSVVFLCVALLLWFHNKRKRRGDDKT